MGLDVVFLFLAQSLSSLRRGRTHNFLQSLGEVSCLGGYVIGSFRAPALLGLLDRAHWTWRVQVEADASYSARDGEPEGRPVHPLRSVSPALRGRDVLAVVALSFGSDPDRESRRPCGCSWDDAVSLLAIAKM